LKTNVGLLDGQRQWLANQGVDLATLGQARNRATLDDAPAGAVPTTQAELVDLLGDQRKVTAHIKAGTFADVIANYSRVVAAQDMDIKRQVNEQVADTLTTFLKDNADKFGAVSRPDLTPAAVRKLGDAKDPRNLHNPRAIGAVLDKEYQSDTAMTDFMRTIWHGADRTADNQAKLSRIRAAFSSEVPSEGGFLVPEVLRAELLRISLETSIVRPRARVIPMDSLRVPFPAIDSTSNVSSVYGGIVGYWTQEGAALTASAAAFSRVVLDAKKLTAYTEVPNELLADSISSFQAFLDQIFPEALGFYEDYGFIAGGGVGEPIGFLNSTAMIAISAESGQASNSIVWENIVNVYSRMLPSSLGRAVWICSIDSFPQLATMALSVGTGGSAIWLNNGQVGPPMTILGRPVIFTEKVTKLGGAGDINFVDLGFYLVGDRQAMSAMSSPHFKFQNDVTAYRIINRVDGQPWVQSAITPKNGGATLSPFVQIAARP
jgi:HK97 family phage major capsid protein